jgi:hypothetical protein
MFTVFQFLNLIQYDIFPTTESIGPFMMHINTTRNIEDTIKSDHHLVNAVDPPTNPGPRTPISTYRSPANSHALQGKPTNLIPYLSNNHSPRSTRSRPLCPPTIQEFKALFAAVQFVSYSKIPGPQLQLPASVKTRTLPSTAKLKAPNYSCSSILQREQLTATTALSPLDDNFFTHHAFLAAPMFHQPLPTAAAVSDLYGDCRSDSSSPDENFEYDYSEDSNNETYEFSAIEVAYLQSPECLVGSDFDPSCNHNDFAFQPNA